MTEQDTATTSPESGDSEPRRGFLVKFATIVVGGLAGLIPLAAGLRVFFFPITSPKKRGEFVRVTSLAALPTDGSPQRFPVIKDQTDAFNRFPEEPVGMVYLRLTSQEPTEVVAFQAVCPHLGCMVDFVAKKNHFSCPCHESFFEVDGERINPKTCPAPRSLDTLDVDADRLAQGEVWVDFKKFRTGTPEKIAK